MIGTEAVRQACGFHQVRRLASEDVVDGDAEASGLCRPCGGFEGRFFKIVGGEESTHVGGDARRIEIPGQNERAGDTKENFADFIELIAVVVVEIGFGDMAGGKRQLRAVEIDMRNRKPVPAQIAEAMKTAFQQWSF